MQSRVGYTDLLILPEDGRPYERTLTAGPVFSLGAGGWARYHSR